MSRRGQVVIRKDRHKYIVKYGRKAEMVAGVLGLALDPTSKVTAQDAARVLVRKRRRNAKNRTRKPYR